MKILLVIDSLGSGGAQRLFANLACERVRNSHSVDVFVYDSSDFYDQNFVNAGVRIIRARKGGRGFSVLVLSSLIALYKKDYNLVFSAMHAPSFYAVLAKMFAPMTELTVCEFSSSHSKGLLLRKLAFYLSTLVANRVICNSIYEHKLMKKLPGRSKKLSSIWNGYNVDEFHFKLPVKNSILTLLVVGRIAYPKNGVRLFRSLQIFEQRHGWCPRLLWAGRRDFDAKSAEMYEEMLAIRNASPGLQNAIELLGETKDIASLYHTSDGLIHMSIYEGLPNVICEAMLYGCPVLASAVCDHPVVLGENRERGLLADPYSVESIADCIEAFQKMLPAERNSIASNAREFALENFDITKMAHKYIHSELVRDD